MHDIALSAMSADMRIKMLLKMLQNMWFNPQKSASIM